MRKKKRSFSIKEKDKMKKKQKEKQIAMVLATGIIASSFPTTITYAQTDIVNELNSVLESNINDALTNNNVLADTNNIQEVFRVTLIDGKNIRAVQDNNYNIILQELNPVDNQWVDKYIMGKVGIKEIVANADGGYTVTYLDYEKNDYFKYKQAYDKNSKKIGLEEICGIEIKTENSDILSLDLVVDKINNRMTIKHPDKEITINEFVPTLCTYLCSKHIAMIGQDSQGNTSILIVTQNGKVINGNILKDAQYFSSDYTEVRSLGLSELEDEKFIISGYAIKNTDPSKKDGFLIQFDGEGNKDSEVKIIPSSYSEKNDASINIVIKSNSGHLLIQGDNLNRMYINALDYVDNRPIKESLTLLNGKRYNIVEEINKSRTVNNDIKTFTVKAINDIFEYDIDTYTNIKDIKLIPGNNNQILIAIQNLDNSTEIKIINTDNDADFDIDGEAISKIVDAGLIKDSNGNILNIDIKTIKVNTNGIISVTPTDSSTPIELTINNVEAGTPIDIITPEPPVEQEPEVTPPVEEEKPEVKPPVENNLIVNVDNGEKIVFDINKPTNIKIISSKLENKDIEYILVNGIKVTKTTIERNLTRNISLASINEYFTTDNGSITLSARLFEDLNLDVKDDYNIGVGFADGTEITNLVKLNIVDTNNVVTPPINDNENNSTTNKEETNNSETINSETNNSEANNSESTNFKINKLPNTGSSASSGISLIFGMISTFMGTILLKKKK